MEQLIGQTLDKYQIVSRLGRGGMAQVYKGYQSNLDRYVAIKVLHSHLVDNPDFVSRFEREANFIARLRHANIVQVFDFDVWQDTYYMVMEFIAGPTLSQELAVRKRSGDPPFSLPEIVHIFDKLAAAIGYAHQRNMIHRDLKPGNIMFSGDGQVLLTDFGLSRLIENDPHSQSGAASGTPAYMPPEQFRGEDIDERSDIYALSVVLYELLTGAPPFSSPTPFGLVLQHMTDSFPALDRLDIPATVEQVIHRASAKEPGARYQTVAEMAAALRAAIPDSITLLPPTAAIATQAAAAVPEKNENNTAIYTPSGTHLTPLTNPYRGLYAFREEDAAFFFGREVFTERLIVTLQKRAMVAVVGPSGSGKSSVVFAGMIPQLRESGSWLIIHCRPGRAPFYALATALVPYLEPMLNETDQLLETRRLADALATGELGLYEVTQRILEKHTGFDRLLLVSDQFEELFTLCEDGDVQRRYPNMLFEGVRTGRHNHDSLALAITLRADFINQALTHRPFADALQDNDVKLGPMNREELGRAIVNPAQLQGVTFEPGLVDRILDDVGREPGNLPLLEFALTLLWEKRTGRRLTHATYDAIGRVEGSLARYADEIFAGLSAGNQERAHRVFTQMVRPGEGTEDTRRVATRTELGENDWALANYLADVRLVVTGRSPDGEQTVEVVHEALIRGWLRLREWMNEDRAFRTWQERLRAARRGWESAARDQGALLRGSLLAEAEEWLDERGSDLSAHERDFIQASSDLRQQRLAEQEAQRQRELDAARQLAEAQQRRADSERQRAEEQAQAAGRLRLLAGGLAVVFLLAVLAALFASNQRQEALWAQATAEAAALARATDVAVRSTAEANAVRSEALAVTREAEAVAAQFNAETERNRANDNEQAALTARDDAEQQRDRADMQALLALSRQLAAQSATFLGNQYDLGLLLSLAAVDLADTAETQASLATGLQSNPRLRGYLRSDHPIQDIRFSPDGRYLASVGDDAEIVLWDLETKEIVQRFSGHDPNLLVNSVVFSPDGAMLVTASDDQTVIRWDVASGAQIGAPLADHRGFVQTVAFSPDGQTFASAGGGGDYGIRIWDAATGELVVPPLIGHTGNTWHITYSPDGRLLASASWDGTIRLWDARTGEPVGAPLTGHPGIVLRVAFSPDGTVLASGGGGDNSIRLWDVATGQPIGAPLLGHGAGVSSLIFSPDGQMIFSVSTDNSVRRWSVANGVPLGPALVGHTGFAVTLDLSPEGNVLATGDRAGNIIFWDVDNAVWPVTAVLPGPTTAVQSVAASPDGRLIAAASGQNQIYLWAVDDLSAPVMNLTHTGPTGGPITALAQSADGRIVASGSANGTVLLWEVTPDGLAPFGGPNPFSAHVGGVTALAFTPDGSTLVTGGHTGFGFLWDINTGQGVIAQLLTGHVADITGFAFSPEGNTLASVSADGSLVLRDTTPGQINFAGAPLFPPEPAALTALAFSADGAWVATAAVDGRLFLWDAASGALLQEWDSGASGPVARLAFAADGRLFSSHGTETTTIRVWTQDDGEYAIIGVLQLSTRPADLVVSAAGITAIGSDGEFARWTLELDEVEQGQLDGITGRLLLSPDGQQVTSSAHSGEMVAVWDLATGRARPLSAVHQAVFQTVVTNVAFTPDGVLVSTGGDGSVNLWDTSSGQPLAAPLVGHRGGIGALAVAPDGAHIATGSCHMFSTAGICLEGEIFYWDLAQLTGERWTADSGFIFDLTFSPDGHSVYGSGCAEPVDAISGCLSGAIFTWEVGSGAVVRVIDGPAGIIQSVAISPDGSTLAGGDNTGITLWNLATGGQIGAPLTAHTGPIQSLIFTADGGTLIAASNDTGVSFWDIPSGQLLGGRVFRHTNVVQDVALLPGGQLMVSGGNDAAVLLWDVDQAAWPGLVCDIVNRDLSGLEWEQFLGDREPVALCE